MNDDVFFFKLFDEMDLSLGGKIKKPFESDVRVNQPFIVFMHHI